MIYEVKKKGYIIVENRTFDLALDVVVVIECSYIVKFYLSINTNSFHAVLFSK